HHHRSHHSRNSHHHHNRKHHKSKQKPKSKVSSKSPKREEKKVVFDLRTAEKEEPTETNLESLNEEAANPLASRSVQERLMGATQDDGKEADTALEPSVSEMSSGHPYAPVESNSTMTAKEASLYKESTYVQ
ncbi:hypothetical protein COOONC_11693, partial [Cooperia oncophora]